MKKNNFNHYFLHSRYVNTYDRLFKKGILR